ncbi:AAA family ATPase [Spirosoma koreense]
MTHEVSGQLGLGKDGLQQSKITLKGLVNEFQRQDVTIKQQPEYIGAFIGQTSNDWMARAKSLPDLKKLFGSLWIEGEICILFASSNQGKSILAVQIAQSISSGIPLPEFVLESLAQLVIYFDFEMSTRQFLIRYCKEGGEPYQWSDNFSRYELNPDVETPAKFACFEDYLVDSIEEVIMRTGAKVLIIDNLTYLSSDTETAKNAAPLMKRLKEMKTRHNLSVLILAHTPKRDGSRPITQSDLQGSSRLMQFCDSSFAIGASTQGSHIKYLKQIKVRSTAYEYDAENVVVCQICKDGNLLQLKAIGYSTEQEHLKIAKENNKAELIAQAKELNSLGKTQRETAEIMGVSPATVNRLLKVSAIT